MQFTIVPIQRLRHFSLSVFVVLNGMLLSGVCAASPDPIGLALLRSVTTNLNGTGVRIAQAEAQTQTNPPTWEVNPGVTGVTQPVSRFTFYSSDGSSTSFPNSLGAESGHADQVARFFYGLTGGVATNVAHVDNYEADYFYHSIVNVSSPANIHDSVVNQSFIFDGSTVKEQDAVDSAYDNYAAQYNTLFVSGAGNGGPVNPPATCYNGLGVAAYGGASSVGPTPDNGRAKPDITAPADATSFSTPQVAGAAALLWQAGLRGDGGPDTVSATDIRTVKALLLNGAVPPAGWTNGPASPLDARYGAGVLNVFNSYEQLAFGKQGYSVSTSDAAGGAHPPVDTGNTIPSLSGWDFNTISSSVLDDGVNHYLFSVTNHVANATFTATITLVWNRHQNQKAINNLDLFLYDTAASNLVASSVSTVDNVEHILLSGLPQGRYDLEVLKHGGLNTVSPGETYALAFEFFTVPLEIAKSGGHAVLTWPIYPSGFVLESATNLNSAVWSQVSAGVTVTNRQNVVGVDTGTRARFFRLSRP